MESAGVGKKKKSDGDTHKIKYNLMKPSGRNCDQKSNRRKDSFIQCIAICDYQMQLILIISPGDRTHVSCCHASLWERVEEEIF